MKVVFCWTDNLVRNIPWMTWRDFWRETCLTYGVTELMVVDCREHHDELKLVTSPELTMSMIRRSQSLAKWPETFVKLDPDAETELSQFSHPEEAVYFFGPDAGPQPDAPIAETVRIETPVPKGLWSIVALGILLQDRHAKGAKP